MISNVLEALVHRPRLPPLIAAKKHSYDLTSVQDNTGNIKSIDIILFCILGNRNFRIPYLLEYYRKMGVDHFCFVDNDSEGGIQESVRDQADCSVWHTNASYKDANFGRHWLNHLLRVHGSGHWCLTIEPDEFIVFPYWERRNLHELVEFLNGERREAFFCVQLDMYGEKPLSQTVCAPGQNPVEVTPYFDGVGYVQSPNEYYGDVMVQGGVRCRVEFRDDPASAPAINKMPLIKWRWHFCYVRSMRSAAPNRLNAPHKSEHLSPTGCLLRFKFLSVFSEKAEEKNRRQEHNDNSREYRWYNELLKEGEPDLRFEKSVKFEDDQQLIDLGLMNRGQWF
jgi:hypothetical protein